MDDAVRSLLVVASSPELYPDLVRAGAAPTLLALLNHENADVAAGVVELLSELTDGDAVEDAVSAACVRPCAWVCGGGVVELLSEPTDGA